MSHICKQLFEPGMLAASPPAGSVNVRIGKAVEGPGGKWVPCATKVAEGIYFSSVFEVGPGRRQVSFPDLPLPCADIALSRALTLAETAAA